MIRARISGRAAAFAIERADGWYLGRRGRAPLAKIAAQDVDRVLGNTSDVIDLEINTVADVEDRMEIEWFKDRTLRLAILALTPTETHNEDIIVKLNEMLSDRHARSYLELQFFQCELPTDEVAAIAVSLSLRHDLTCVSNFFGEIVRLQSTVARVRFAFDEIDPRVFGERNEKERFRESAVQLGAFRDFVISVSDNTISSNGLFSLHRVLQRLPNGRSVVQAWTAAFDRPRIHLPPMPKYLEEDTEAVVVDFGGGPSGYEQLRNALEQQQAILEKVAAGDYATAKRYSQDLSRQQLAEGGAPYLAKSLTRLSQSAREMEAFELQLEWAFDAVRLQPADARTHTQYADALLQSDRIDEAIVEYDKAASLGENEYALAGKARSLRQAGQLTEALKLFAAAEALLEGVPEQVHPAIGRAQTIEELGEPDAAFDLFSSIVERFPFEALAHLSLATQHLKRREFNTSWNCFETAMSLPDGIVPGANGLAEICRKTGKLAEAKQRYQALVDQHPRDIKAHIGLIRTLQAQGEFQRAASFAKRVSEKFPGSPSAALAHAETTSQMGWHSQARHLFETALTRFPRDARLIGAQAASFRREGRYERALDVLDAGSRRFPHNLSLKRSRAGMLRILGNLVAAKEQYAALMEADKTDLRALNGVASIELLEGSMSVEALLPANDNPMTSDEWRSFLIRAVDLQRRGKRDDSGERLEWGLEQCPFAAERRLFAAAIALQATSSGHARRAPRIEHTPERDICNLIDFGVAAMSRRARAKLAFTALNRNLPKQLHALRDEIARRYGVIEGRAHRSRSWIDHRMNEEFIIAIAA